MQNGCICCTLGEDLLEEINRLADLGCFDYLIIESTGVSEPMQVAETFTTEYSQSLEEQHEHEDEEKHLEIMKALKAFSENAKLDTCVSMVDASSFYTYFNSSRFIGETFDDAGDEEERSVVSLIIDQIEFADVILLNKIDACTAETSDKIEAILKGLNKTAKVIRCKYSKVDVKQILDTGLFDMEKAVASPGWLQSLQEEILLETVEYGISSFVYCQRKPFHPNRLFDLAKQVCCTRDSSSLQYWAPRDRYPLPPGDPGLCSFLATYNETPKAPITLELCINPPANKIPQDKSLPKIS